MRAGIKNYSHYQSWGSWVCLLFAYACLSGCNEYKMERVLVTIEILDNGVVKTGSAVQEIGCKMGDPAWGSMDTSGCIVNGEAAYVTIAPKKYLVMPFQGGRSLDWTGYGRDISDYKEVKTKTDWDVKSGQLPVMVTFDNPETPSSVKLVNPRDLATTFGPGVSLNAIHVRRTKEPVTHGKILTAFPWLQTFSEGTNLEGKTTVTTSAPAQRIQKLHFINRIG